MDLCSLEDAFPNVNTGSISSRGTAVGDGSGLPYVGGTDGKPTREERRAARKRAKKCKSLASKYYELQGGELPPVDPDRPYVRPTPTVEALQVEKEEIMTSPLPVLPKASCLLKDSHTPSYFGRSEDDGDDPSEGYSNFNALGGDDPSYRLEPDVLKAFDGKGLEKVSAGALPEPNLSDNWKPMTPAASYTAFFSGLPTSVAARPGWAMDMSRPEREAAEPVPVRAPLAWGQDRKGERDALLGRVEELMGRLETLEKKRTQNTQTELLLFVGTGLFLLLAFDLSARRR